MSIKKFLFLSCSLGAFTSGCTRVDTDPTLVFNQIQEDISCLTAQDIYWDKCLADKIVPLSVEEILKKELDESDVINIALLNNRNLQAIYENLGIAKAQLSQAALLKNPIFSLAYRFSTKSNITDLINVDLLQNFLEILLIPMKKKMAAAELEATKAMVTTQVLDVIAEVKMAFYHLKAAQQIWELKKQILLATELSYEAAKKLFEADNIIALDVEMERAVYEQTKLEVASWEITVLEAREKLNVLMGLWGQQIEWNLSPDFPEIPSEEEDYTNIENVAIACSIDLQSAYNELLAVAARFGIDTSRLIFPQFDLGASSEREEGIWYVGPAFNLPLPIFDIGKANSAKAQATILRHWNEYTALAVEVRSKARASRFSLLNAFRQSQYLGKVITPLAEQILMNTLLQYNAMQIGIFRLLIAKQNEIEKRIQYVSMQRDYWIAKTELQLLLAGHMLGKSFFETPLRRHYDE